MQQAKAMTATYECRYRGHGEADISYTGIIALTSTDPEQARFEALVILAERFPREPDEIRLRVT